MGGVINNDGQGTIILIGLGGLATLSGNGGGVDDNRADLTLGSILERRNLVLARTSLAQLPLV